MSTALASFRSTVPPLSIQALSQEPPTHRALQQRARDLRNRVSIPIPRGTLHRSDIRPNDIWHRDTLGGWNTAFAVEGIMCEDPSHSHEGTDSLGLPTHFHSGQDSRTFLHHHPLDFVPDEHAWDREHVETFTHGPSPFLNIHRAREIYIALGPCPTPYMDPESGEILNRAVTSLPIAPSRRKHLARALAAQRNPRPIISQTPSYAADVATIDFSQDFSAIPSIYTQHDPIFERYYVFGLRHAEPVDGAEIVGWTEIPSTYDPSEHPSDGVVDYDDILLMIS